MNNDEDGTDCIQVTLTRSPLHGFGIAINSGNDNVDSQSLLVTDVIKNGPADGKLLPNDRIVNVNGHPVVRYMEHTALKLIRESTDFVNLIIERPKHPIIVSDIELPIKYIMNKTRKGDKFGITLDCRYFIKKIHLKNNELFANIQEDDEVIKINETPINRLTLQEAQKLIDRTKEQLILHTIPKKYNKNQRIALSSYKQLQSDYNQYIFEQSTSNHRNVVRPSNSTRYVSFFTDTSSIGIRLAGGNKYGLFICEIQHNSIAYKAGLFVADKIFSVNNIDFTNITREDAVLCLMNMKAAQVNMIVSNLPDEYEQLLGDVGGDSFYIRTHFAYNSLRTDELSIVVNDIFHVTDTLYNGQVGSWVATKLSQSSSDNKQSGAIPNQSRAEQLVESAPKLDELIKLRQSSFKRKLRTKFSDKRSRSFLSLNQLKDDSILTKVACWKPITNAKFSAYERVRLKSITIIRPVVLLGPLADIARDRLIDQYPDKFELPETYITSTTKARANIIKLQSIKNVIQKNRHCLLDISPSAIEQLNNAECYPIVVFFKVSNRNVIKEIRNEYGKFYQKSSRRLCEHAEHLDYFYSYLFTSVINVDSSKNWYETLKSHIEYQQAEPIWMSNDQFIEKDLLKSDEYFISTRLSDSDEFSFHDQSSSELDITNKKEKRSLQRVLSDPMVFRKDNFFKTFLTDLSHRISHDEEENDSTCLQTSSVSLFNHNQSLIEIPTIDNEQSQYHSDLIYSNNSFINQRSHQSSKVNNNINNEYLIQTDKLSVNRILSLNQYEKNLINNESKVVSTHSLINNELSSNPNLSLRRPLISQQIPLRSHSERMNSNDNPRSIQKNLTDKSTMTDKNSTTHLYATCNRSKPLHLKNVSNTHNDNMNSKRYTSIESVVHNKHIQSDNLDEKISAEFSMKQKSLSHQKETSQLNNGRYLSDHSKLSLEKPRVYIHNDPISLKQTHTIFSSSSSSESSLSSFKDKAMKEVGETRSYSIQDGTNVIGSARGIIDYYGGKLSCPLTGVSLFIPMGAISQGIQQEIYFQVHQDSSHTEQFHGQLLSPIVICGPHGIKFEKPVELIIPHSAGDDAQQLSLLLHGTNHESKINYQQHNKSIIMNGINHVTNSNVSILVDHF